jgi:hypothetical protein
LWMEVGEAVLVLSLSSQSSLLPRWWQHMLPETQTWFFSFLSLKPLTLFHPVQSPNYSSLLVTWALNNLPYLLSQVYFPLQLLAFQQHQRIISTYLSLGAVLSHRNTTPAMFVILVSC